jgi:hypothetical protein
VYAQHGRDKSRPYINTQSIEQLEQAKEDCMDYRLYHIALSPDLDITPEEFADAWNEADEAREIDADIQLSQTSGAKFLDPVLVGALLSVPATVVSSEIYDLIKSVVHRLREKKGQAQSQAPHRHIQIVQTKKPDGTEILAIDIDE